MSTTYNQPFFRGYSTIGAERTGETRLTDVALIKQDLMNHFQTRVGERVMRPDWGCHIWEYFMEPLTPQIVDQIESEARRICEEQRGRVEVISVNTIQFDSGVRVDIVLRFTPLGVIDTFSANFEARQSSAG